MCLKRNGYIDVIKFLFAIMIVEFHLQTGVFPGGRVAVDGFFMISAYLMMKYLERDRYPQEHVGLSCVRFLWRKYIKLFWVLLPSALLSFGIHIVIHGYRLPEILKKGVFLFFELLPLRTAGFSGSYVVGISWYLSSMMIALAILYPFCRVFRSKFTLTVCPLMAVLFYGILCHTYKHLAVGTEYLENTAVNTGILRALAASSLGILIYEISVALSQKKLTAVGRAFFTAVEAVGFVFFLYVMHNYPKSTYEYLQVFVLFLLLTIGICGLSATSAWWSGRWTKLLGTCSTLMVLNHFAWMRFLSDYPLDNMGKDEKILFYVAAIAVSCAVVQVVSTWLEKTVCGILANRGKLFE